MVKNATLVSVTQANIRPNIFEVVKFSSNFFSENETVHKTSMTSSISQAQPKYDCLLNAIIKRHPLCDLCLLNFACTMRNKLCRSDFGRCRIHSSEKDIARRCYSPAKSLQETDDFFLVLDLCDRQSLGFYAIQVIQNNNIPKHFYAPNLKFQYTYQGKNCSSYHSFFVFTKKDKLLLFMRSSLVYQLGCSIHNFRIPSYF